jgi:hypothetical protein
MKSYITRRLLEKEIFYEHEDYFYLAESSSTHLLDLLKRRLRKIVILGDAGYGKSTELEMVFSSLVSEKNPDFVPILTRLDTYADEDLEDYIRLKVGKESERIFTYNEEKLVFLIDEFDQVLDKGRAERKINNFIEKHPKSVFVITSRTNFYSGQFPDFKVYVLPPFSIQEIKELADKELSVSAEVFMNELEQKNVLPIAKNPFCLTHLISIFKVDKAVPGNDVEVMNRMVVLFLKNDVERLREQYDLEQVFPVTEITKELKRMSLVTETLQKNHLSMNELYSVIKDPQKRIIITQLSLMKQTFSKDGSVYQFQHNNFQEFLAAAFLSKASMKQILDFICFSMQKSTLFLNRIDSLLDYFDLKIYGVRIDRLVKWLKSTLKYKRLSRINPSWLNTVAYLCRLTNSNDLLSYCMKHEPEMALKFEVDRTREKDREQIFKNVFEKYTGRHIWLDAGRVDLRQLAGFGQTKNLHKYLVSYLTDGHYVSRYNAIILLTHIPAFKDEKLKDLLINIALDQKENSVVRHVSLHALSQLYQIDEALLDKLKVLMGSDDERVIAGFLQILQKSDAIDNYVDFLIDILSERKKFTLVDVSWNAREAITLICSPAGIKRLFNILTKNPDVLASYDIEKILPAVVRNTVAAFEKDASIYEDVKAFVMSLKHHRHKLIETVADFFRATGTSTKLFSELCFVGIKQNDVVLVFLADEDSMDFISEEYLHGNIGDEDVKWFINSLGWVNTPKSEKLTEIIRFKTGKFAAVVKQDYEEVRQRKLKRKIELLLDKTAFLREVKCVFESENKTEFSFLELETLCDNEENGYDEFVLRQLLALAEKSGNKLISLKTATENIEEPDFDWWAMSNLYEIMQHGSSSVDLDPQQIEKVKNFCLGRLDQINFSTVIKKKDHKSFEVEPLALFLWLFKRKFGFIYPQEVLLDMLSFDWIEGNDFVGIDYLLEELTPDAATNRILSNLEKELVDDQVFKNHIKYCGQHNITAAQGTLEKIAQEENHDPEIRALALRTLIDFGISADFLRTMLCTDDMDLFLLAANALMKKTPKTGLHELRDMLKSKNAGKALASSEILIREQDLQGLKFYAKHLKLSKRFVLRRRDKSVLTELKNPRALGILINLLRFALKNRGKIEEDEFATLESVILGALRNLAIENYHTFHKASKAIQKLILHEQKNLPSVEFLNAYLDNMENAFLANCSNGPSLKDAISKVEALLP